MTSNKNSFVFYETFEEVIDELPEGLQLKFYKYITQYGLHGIEPEVTGIEKAIWTQIQFAIDQAQSRRKRAIENGNKGGRPKNETQKNPSITQKNPKETKKNQDITQAKPKHNLNVNVNVNENDNVNVNDNVTNSDSKESQLATKKRFVKPTVEEIATYCFTRNNNIRADQFFDYYESKGWKVGNTPMKDWKAAIRTWETRSSPPSARGHPSGMSVTDEIKPNQIIF